MNARRMRNIGIAVMLLAHPVGFWFWEQVTTRFLPYRERPYEPGDVTNLASAGILEFFLIGLTLFVMGMIGCYREKKGQHKE